MPNKKKPKSQPKASSSQRKPVRQSQSALDLLFEAFQVSAKRSKTPLNQKDIDKYVVNTFKKLPKVKRTKVLETQLREVIQEYLLLQSVNGTKLPQAQKAPQAKSSDSHIEASFDGEKSPREHILSQPHYRTVAAAIVIAIGLLVAVPLMSKQSQENEPGFRQSFNDLKGSFQGIMMEDSSDVSSKNIPHYSFVLKDGIPPLPRLSPIRFTYDSRVMEFDDPHFSPEKTLYPASSALSSEQAVQKVQAFMEEEGIVSENLNGPFVEEHIGASCFGDNCEYLKELTVEGFAPTEVSSYIVYFTSSFHDIQVYGDSENGPKVFRSVVAEVSRLSGNIFSFQAELFHETPTNEIQPLLLEAPQAVAYWIENDLSTFDDSFVRSQIPAIPLSKKTPILLESPRYGYYVKTDANVLVPAVIFNAIGEKETGGEVRFTYAVSLI